MGANEMRIAVVICLLMGAAPAQASMLGCEKTTGADPVYCQKGERRATCLQAGYLVWTDTRDHLSNGEFAFLSGDGPVPRLPCPKTPAK
jgi:hypothetical protein